MSKAAQDSYFWHLSDQEHQFIKKYRGLNRLKCATLLKYYQIEVRFPEKFSDIPDIGRKILSENLKVSDDVDPDYDYMDRTGKRFIFAASSQAQKAADFLFSLQENPSEVEAA